jgi:hypothetical protein
VIRKHGKGEREKGRMWCQSAVKVEINKTLESEGNRESWSTYSNTKRYERNAAEKEGNRAAKTATTTQHAIITKN